MTRYTRKRKGAFVEFVLKMDGKKTNDVVIIYSVVTDMRLASGTLWPMPITLDVNQDKIDASKIQANARIALLDPRDYEALAILTVEDVYRPDKSKEAIGVYGADDQAHPAVSYLHNIAGEFYVGGSLQAIQAPAHYDYVASRCKFIFCFWILECKCGGNSWDIACVTTVR